MHSHHLALLKVGASVAGAQALSVEAQHPQPAQVAAHEAPPAGSAVD